MRLMVECVVIEFSYKIPQIPIYRLEREQNAINLLLLLFEENKASALISELIFR